MPEVDRPQDDEQTRGGTGDAPVDDSQHGVPPVPPSPVQATNTTTPPPPGGDAKPTESETPPASSVKGPKGTNTGNGTDGTDPEEKPIVVDGWGVAAIVVLAVVIIVALFAIDRAIPAPGLVDPGSPVATSAQLAYYLARWGLVLTVVGFVSLLVAQVMRTFRFRAPKPKLEAAGEAAVAPWDKLFDAIPGLIKNPVGVGMALILIAATLLIGVTVASNDDTTEPEPSASPAAEESESPSPEPTVSPSASPSP